ncbi:elongation factor P [Candidatus Acetothermia bacterium]|nr:elongation factor P [Candidatus Acetothermia bacterium]MBI3643169.1 elongation factor P [Candidatus Acetothermia bacterium]
MGVNDISKGVTIQYEGELYTVVDYAHMFKGRGKAVAQTKLKHLQTGRVIPRTITETDDFKVVRMEEREIKYLYGSGDEYVFMENESYEQFTLTRDQIGELKDYMLENTDMRGYFYNDKVLKVELPITVELKVVKTTPGVRGDTVSGGDKPATLETGAEVKVPLFIKEGEVIKVDTRDGSYVERVR